MLDSPKTNPNYYDELDVDFNEILNTNSLTTVTTDKIGSDLLDSAIVDLDMAIKDQPKAISFGDALDGGPAVFGTYGDYSCISGPSKSRKTFLKSAIVASYIGGQNKHFQYFKNYRVGDEIVIDIDTEQSEFHSVRAFKRVELMTGSRYENYVPISLREYSSKERLQVVEEVFKRYGDRIGLVSIDGFADLIEDFNSLEQGKMITDKLLYWSKMYNCHITGILHLNPKDQKVMGHIGSAVMRKAETIAYVIEDAQDPTYSRVDCRYSRNSAFTEFRFNINIDGLPYEENAEINF